MNRIPMHRRRGVVAAAGLIVLSASLSAVAVLGGGSVASADQTIDHTFVGVVCTADVNGTPMSITQDITISFIAPDFVAPNANFTVTFPGGSADLPTQGNGIDITNYSNLFTSIQIHGTKWTAGSIVNPGTATLLPYGSDTPLTVSFQAAIQSSSGTLNDLFTSGEPGPFPPGTLTTPTVSIKAKAPASGSVTINAYSLTSTVLLNGAVTAAATCAIPQDTLATIPVGTGLTTTTAPSTTTSSTTTSTSTTSTSTTTTTPSTLQVNAGGPVSGDVGTAIPLHGTVTDDPGNTPTVVWTSDNPLNCSFADPTAADTTITCTKAGVVAATLTAHDGVNPDAQDTAEVTVTTPNQPPIVAAGPDTGGEINDDIALHGTVTDSDSPGVLSQWTVDNPGVCSFSDDTNPDTVINCSVAGTYSATLTADDGINVPVTDTAIVTVTNPPPGLTVIAGPDASGNTNTAIPLKGKITDPGNSPTASWSSDSNDCTFASPSSPITTITCTTPGVVAATLTGSDAVNGSETDTALVTVIQPNAMPVVNAGPDVSGVKNSAIALSGSVTDSDSSPTITWTSDTPGCSFANSGMAVTTITCPNPGVVAATLTADDGENPAVSDVALVTVYGNAPPTVNAGPDVTTPVNVPVALDGSASDPDDTPTLSWSSGDPNCTFSAPSSADTTITCSDGGIIAATLTASDGTNAPVSDTALVTVVVPNTAPTVDAGPDVTGVAQHAVSLSGTVTDPDDIPTIHWSNTNPGCVFSAPTSLNTTITCATAGIYAATLTADDGVNPAVSDTALVTLTPPTCTVPSICVSIGDSTTWEGGVVDFRIVLNQPQTVGVKVTATIHTSSGAGYATNGTGLPAGSVYDFKSAVAHTITIAAGTTQAVLSVTSLRDALSEPDETFTVTLSNPTGVAGVKIGRGSGLGTIKDDTGMGPNEILIGSSTVPEPDACTACKAVVRLNVVLSSAPVSSMVTMKYQTGNPLSCPCATAGTDYTALNLTNLNFNVGGASQKTIMITVKGDNAPEPNEGFDVVFSNVVGGALSHGTRGNVVILDND